MSRTIGGNTRSTGKEQYYTPPVLCEKIVKVVINAVSKTKNAMFIEPSAGTGNFVKALEKNGISKDSILALDIEPKHKTVNKSDFLTSKIKKPDKFSPIIYIGNPPFGRNNSLCIPFFNKAAEDADYICFIVPKSWRKWSVINKLDRHFHLEDDFDVTVEYEDVDGNPINGNVLKTCFQIWKWSDKLREEIKVEDRGYLVKSTCTAANVRIRQCGYNAGKIETSFDRSNDNSNFYFFKVTSKVLAALKKIESDLITLSKNTSFVPSISVPEINYLLNKVLK